jgi:2-amino-4-hydroxy-6-hydroxymethyldihydropteridine diphosphokinase
MFYRKKLAKKLEIIKTPLFPKIYKSYTLERGKPVLLGIGGNIGDTIRIFEKLIYKLDSFSDIELILSSIILKNPPFGYLEQSHFFNSLILIHTSLSPLRVLNRVLKIEKSFGRRREFKNSPRTLDIDIVFYGNVIVDKKTLKLPHPHWRERESVLIPMKFLINEKKVLKSLFKPLTRTKKKDTILSRN